MPKGSDIKCPKCGEPIPLDETFAAPLIARIQSEANSKIKKAQEEANDKVSEATTLQASLAAKELELLEREGSIQTEVNHALAVERKKIAEQERESVLKEISIEIEAERNRSKDLGERLETSQRAELQLRQEKERVDERSKSLDLEVARRVDEQRKTIHEQARKEIEDAAQAKISKAEKDLDALQKEIDAKVALTDELTTNLAEKEKELLEKDASVQNLIIQAVAVERKKIVEIERENVRKELAPELDAERVRSQNLQDKLEAAKRTELQLRQEKQEVDDRAKDIDLEVARKVDEQKGAIQERAQIQADEAARLKIAERDKTIADMQLKLEEAQRKAAQGSQQLQGEVLELDFESILRQQFPQDLIEPVKTGARGGDILQRVLGQMARPVATVFWETKRAQAWGGEWTTKAKKDAAEEKAEVALIVSEVLPKGVRAFGFYEGVWCTTPSCAVMLGHAIRQGLIAVSEARQGLLGRETKKDRLYDYMIGPEFRATVEGIALPFKEIYDELAAEKRATLSRWKRQEKRLERVLANIAGLQGSLQGIAGSEMPQLPGFELEAKETALLE